MLKNSPIVLKSKTEPRIPEFREVHYPSEQGRRVTCFYESNPLVADRKDSDENAKMVAEYARAAFHKHPGKAKLVYVYVPDVFTDPTIERVLAEK